MLAAAARVGSDPVDPRTLGHAALRGILARQPAEQRRQDHGWAVAAAPPEDLRATTRRTESRSEAIRSTVAGRRGRGWSPPAAGGQRPREIGRRGLSTQRPL